MNGAPGTSPGSLCQCLATLTAEELPLMPGLSLPRRSSVLTHTSHRQPAAEAGASLSTPILRKPQRSPLGLLLSRRQPRCPQVSALTVENQGCQSPEPFFWLQAPKDHQKMSPGHGEHRAAQLFPAARCCCVLDPFQTCLGNYRYRHSYAHCYRHVCIMCI